MEKEIGKNKKAEEVFGLRDFKNCIPIDTPCELNFHCPVCEYELETNGEFDDRLTWSEYNCFMYCSICRKDYPSCFCHLDVDKCIDIFLSSVTGAGKPLITYGESIPTKENKDN